MKNTLFSHPLLIALAIWNSASFTSVGGDPEVTSTCGVNEHQLSRFIAEEYRDFKEKQPMIRLLNIFYTGGHLQVYPVDGAEFGQGEVSEVLVSDEDEVQMSEDGIIAYHPRFPDVDNSFMAAGILNITKIFPCLQRRLDEKGRKAIPLCRVNHDLEGGFLKGKQILLIGDDGLDIMTFGEGIPTVAFGIKGCNGFTTKTDSCLHGSYQFGIACILPGQYCAVDETAE